MVIKSVCFDLGGVLIQNATHVFYQRTVDRLGKALPEVSAVFEKHRGRLERGEISNEDFWKALAQDLEVPYAPEMLTLWSERFVEETPPIPGMIELVDQLRTAGYKVGLLSNTTEQHVAINRTRSIFEHFDAALMSNEIGTRKPEKEAYLKLLEAVGTQAGETVFIDDLSENVAGAQAVGIKGIKFEGREPLTAQLTQLGVNL